MRTYFVGFRKGGSIFSRSGTGEESPNFRAICVALSVVMAFSLSRYVESQPDSVSLDPVFSSFVPSGKGIGWNLPVRVLFLSPVLWFFPAVMVWLLIWGGGVPASDKG